VTRASGAASIDPGTDLLAPVVGGPDVLGTAVQAADVAARLAGVQIRELANLDELQAVFRLYDEIWGPDLRDPPVNSQLLRAFSKTGNYVTGAFDGQQLVGACVGFFGAPAEAALHSHIAGVSGAAQGRSVGFALKVHQRAWCLLHGVTAVAWTYDPLIRRNAYFNLVKLGARPEQYLADFYGGMQDAINAGAPSDRLLVRWDLEQPAVAAACLGDATGADAQAELAAGAEIALGTSATGAPQVGSYRSTRLLVAVPDDVETLRLSQPGVAADWRLAVREVLGGLLADGARVTAFDRRGWYVLDRATTSEGNQP
jgi:predicted GNAT superfamily acetyltransferase